MPIAVQPADSDRAILIRLVEANRIRLTQLVAALVATAALASAAIVMVVWRAAG